MLNILLIGLTLVWIYFLTILKRSHLNSFLFLIGSFGLFLILTLSFNFLIIRQMIHLTAEIMSMGTKLFHFYHVDIASHTIIIKGLKIIISYELSCAVEIIAYLSLLTFYPLYSVKQKPIIGILGTFLIIFANSIRIGLILGAIFYLGNSVFFIMNFVIGRLFIYIVIVIIFYETFTRPPLTLS